MIQRGFPQLKHRSLYRSVAHDILGMVMIRAIGRAGRFVRDNQAAQEP